MNAELGVSVLLLVLICILYAVVAALIGERHKNPSLIESARNAALMTFPLLTLACVLLIALQMRGDFNVSYVWSTTSRSMPAYLKVTALWGGQEGSLLFWSFLMSLFTTGALLQHWDKERALMSYVIAFTMGSLGFFVLLVTFWENPFATFWVHPDGQIIPSLFGPSPFLGDLAKGIASGAEAIPGLLGVVAKGLTLLAAPPGSVLTNPLDGQGLNPLLRHPGMIIHPPMLYLGFVGLVIPYAFAMAALASNQISDVWIRATRRWTLIAWLFLSLGLIIGGWWAYDVLGWGGYWGWDPVENAAFMPWLTATAFLHSVMIQEKRGMLKRWNMVLVIATFLLVILGTFATRSGFVSSVHSFARSAIGPLFFVFLAVSFVLSLILLSRRWETLVSENRLDSLLSRETLFLVNNFLFVAIAVAVGIGTYWPTFTEVLSEFIPSVEKSSLGPSYYERTTGPLFLVLLLLMGIAPLVAWKHASIRRLGLSILYPLGVSLLTLAGLALAGIRNPIALLGLGICLLTASITAFEFHRGAAARKQSHGEPYWLALARLTERNRRRYGGYVIHLGVIIMSIGILSSTLFQQETQKQVSAGETLTIGSYILEYETLERFMATDGRSVVQARGVIYHNGRKVGDVTPRIDSYPNGQPMSIPSVYQNLLGDDFYVLLVSWEPATFTSATFKIYINPLVNWIWIGGLVFIAGTMVATWPDPREERQLESAIASQQIAPSAAGD